MSGMTDPEGSRTAQARRHGTDGRGGHRLRGAGDRAAGARRREGPVHRRGPPALHRARGAARAGAGPRFVAKAWLDPEFRRLALEDAIAASREMGIDWLHPTGFGTPSDFTAFEVLEDTPTLHHVIVCSLCSCYPRPMLGMSPEWYRTPNYRRRIVRWPRQVLAEFGLYLTEDVEVRVEDSNSKHRFMVLPVRPDGTEGWSEEQLAEIVTRDCLIGVALPKPGVTADVVARYTPRSVR